LTPDQLLDLHRVLCGRAQTIMVAKNRDYRGAGDDPFANFRGSEFLGVDPILGILMRCMDKFQRIRSFATTGTLAVKSESFEDAVVDVINYMVLAAGMAKEREALPHGCVVAEPMTLEEAMDRNVAYLKSLPESQIPKEPPTA
jgi:hypothetical protein